MGGSGRQPLNIFKLSLGDSPREVNNCHLWFAVISFGMMGIARGLDDGLITGTLKTDAFQDLLELGDLDTKAYAKIKGNISAMVLIGSVAGALLAFAIGDMMGRLWITRQLTLTWILGIVVFLTNDGRLGQVYAGRFIAGIGVGEATVIAPVFIAEIAPKAIRGLCMSFFAGSVYLGIMLAYFVVYGSNLHIPQTSYSAWAVPTSLHIIFAGAIFILSWFNYESPRYLIRKGQEEHAIKNLTHLRGLAATHPAIVSEIRDIKHQLEEEQEATMGSGWLGYLKEMFLLPENFYRIYIGLGSQIFAQWSGAGSITLYASDFFALLGTSGQSEQLLVTCIFGIVKFVAALICGLFLIDMVGRKRSLSVGIFLQAISMVYIAAFLSAVPNIDADDFTFTKSQKSASVGAIVFIYISGFGWGMGWNSIQYLLNAEIFPLRIRSMSTAMVMCFHFANQYGNSRAVPQMLLPTNQGGISSAGTFWTFAVITVLGFFWAWFFIPETAGLGLEEIDELFKLKWWQIGRKGNIFARETAEMRREEGLNDITGSDVQKPVDGVHVENARNKV